MALRHAVLAALLEGDASGYDLAKRFDVSVANYWPATPQQLYRELERMTADGVVAARIVEQERRPNKRVFSITPAGRTDLATFTAHPPRPSAWRDELLVQLAAVDIGDGVAVAAALAERLDHARSKLELYARLRDDVLQGRTEDELVAGDDRIGPYLTLVRGIRFERENQEWCEWALGVLRSRSDRARPEAPRQTQ